MRRPDRLADRWLRVATTVTAALLTMLLGADPAAAGPATAQIVRAAVAASSEEDSLESRGEHLDQVTAELDQGQIFDAVDIDGAEWVPDDEEGEVALPAEPTPEETTETTSLASPMMAMDDGTTTSDAELLVDTSGIEVEARTVPGSPIAVEQVETHVADAATAALAGTSGPLVILTSPPAESGEQASKASGGATSRVQRPTGDVELSVSYAALADRIGGDWASRLRLVAIPECALEQAEETEGLGNAASGTDCEPTPIESSVNNTGDQTVTAKVGLSATGTSMVALTAGTSGSAGDWGATSLAPSASWGVAGSSGAFTWSYSLRTPGVSAGPSPELGLSYSSATSDGRVASTNNQTSWVGEGFDVTSSFVERTFVPCADDQDVVDGQTPNNADRLTGDLCIGEDNATLTFNGSAVELNKGADGQWYSKNHDGTKVTHHSGADNGDKTGEFWKVTTVDGTQYYFGRDERPSDGLALNSSWTVPVYGNHPGEDCYEPSADGGFGASRCTQTYRWMLDYVVDPSDNSMTYVYETQVRKYGYNLGAGVEKYVAGGNLLRIEYGTRQGAEATGTAPVRVEFDTTSRCVPGTGVDCAVGQIRSNAAAWPDVPADLVCVESATTCPDEAISPAFYSTRRLAKISTSVRVAGAYVPVDSWQLDQSFLDPGDGSLGTGGTGRILWLKKITHTGHGGTATTGDDKALPAVVFQPTRTLRNRVDSGDDGYAAMFRPRVLAVRTESGAKISVNYRTECSAGDVPGDPAENSRLCFPVKWDGDAIDWFHKYVVSSVVQDGSSVVEGTNQLVTGSGQVTTSYLYEGGAGWAKPTGALVKPKEVTYSDFRGFGTVTTVTGEGGDASTSVARYFRGMGDELTVGPPGNTVTVTDDERYQGQVLSTWDQTGDGKRVSQSVTVPGDIVTVAKDEADKTISTRIASSTARGYTFNAAGDVAQQTRTETSFDANSQVKQIDDIGAVGIATDDVCTRITYAHSSDTTLAEAHIVGAASRTEVVAKECATTPARPADVITDTLAVYDQAGRTTETWEVDPELDPDTGTLNPATKAGYLRTAKVTYDALGRVTAQEDALGRVSGTEYTPSTASVVSSVKTISPQISTAVGKLEQITTINPATGSVLSTTDPNGKVTAGTYDGLGRLTSVRYPQHANAGVPSVEYEYTVRANGLNVVLTKTIGADGERQHASATLYDGLMRAFQTQAEGVDSGETRTANATARGRVVTHTLYDTAGRVKKAVGDWWAKGVVSATPVEPPPVTESATTYVYDGAGRPTNEIFWTGTSANPEYEKWRTVTDYDGQYTTVLPPVGGTASTTVTDARGRGTQLWRWTSRPNAAASGFDPRTAAASGYQVTRYVWDAAGQLSAMSDPAGNQWTYEYDFAGNAVRAADPDAGVTTTDYDEVGQVEKVTDATGSSLAYTYDPLGRVTLLADGAGTARARWTYDQTLDAAGEPLLGQVSSSTRIADGASYTTKVDAYDAAYRPTSTTVTLPSGGALAELGEREFTTKSTYTADGQVASMTLPRVTSAGGSLAMGSERVTTHYDTASMPEWMGGGFGWGTYVAASRFSATGQPTLMDLGNTYGAVVSYQYESGTKRLEGIKLDRERFNGADLDVHYGYDDGGNVTSVKDTPTAEWLAGLPEHQDNQCFSYDGLQQLTVAWTPHDGVCDQDVTPIADAALGGAAAYWNEYTYDAQGRRTDLVSRTKEEVGGAVTTSTTTYTHGAGLGSSNAALKAGPHAVVASRTVIEAPDGTQQVTTGAFGYDASGRQITRPGLDGNTTESLTWDPEGELSSVVTTGDGSEGDGTSADADAQYVYSADGDRMVRSDSTGTTVYLPGGQEVHVDAEGVVSATRHYGFAGQSVAVRQGKGLQGVTSLVCDPHGTALAAVPNTTWTRDSVVRQYTDPFGAARGADAEATVQSVPGDRQFLGKTRDDHTGLTLLGARWYDESLGQFLSADPVLEPGVPAQFNAYLYSGNNPMTWADPSGMSWLSDTWNSAKKAVTKGSFWSGAVVGTIVGGIAGAAVFAACTAATGGLGVAGCAVAGVVVGGMVAGAVGSLVANAHATAFEGQRQKSARELAGEAGAAAVVGGVTAGIGKLFSPMASRLAGSMASASQSIVSKTSFAQRLATAQRASAAQAAERAQAARVSEAVTNLRTSRNSAASGADEIPWGAACSFAGATPVLMADGSRKPIQDVEVGDQVVATDPETGERVSKRVTHVWVHLDDLFEFEVDGELIFTTDDHPFWSVTDQAWESSRDLDRGELVTTADGRALAVSREVDLRTRTTAIAYNLTVAGLHTYHIGATGVLVHNTCPNISEDGFIHSFTKHGREWFGGETPAKSSAAHAIQAAEWAGLIQNAARSQNVVPWSSGSKQTYAHITRVDGKWFVAQFDRSTGELVTAFRPKNAQMGAMQRLLNGS